MVVVQKSECFFIGDEVNVEFCIFIMLFLQCELGGMGSR